MKNLSSDEKNKRYFCTEHLKADLKGRSVRSGAATIAGQVGKFSLQTTATVVMARLLTPEDYGLFGMVTVITNFAVLFNDLGLSTATIQKAQIDHRQVSTLFWINVALGCSVALIVAALAPAVAWFYDEPRLTGIMLGLSLNFIFSGLTVQHNALLKRQMCFATLARIQIISMFTTVVTGIIFALCGLGYWALIFMQWVGAFTYLIGVWVACGWRPGLPVKGSGIASMLAFGGNVTGFKIVDYWTRSLDNLLIGRYWGPQELGLYAKAYQLLLMPIRQINNPMTSVALPALSSLQSEPQRYRAFYCKAILSITTLGMPIAALMFASADKVILLMLGKDWLGAVPLFRLLMPAAFVGTLNVATGWICQSLGTTDRQLRAGLITSTIVSIIFLISVRWGTTAVAAAFGLSQPILVLFAIIYCYKGTPLRLSDLASTIYRPALASIGAAAILMSIQDFLPTAINIAISLLVDFVLYGFFYIAIWMVLPKGRQTLVELLSTFKSLKK
jgi:O-antigen/teichoic acid export membrane protein